jgi:AcrR family transcriptional regulator
VDARLLHHYFQGKEEIFVAAMDFPLRPSRVFPSVLEGDTDELGTRVARFFFETWDAPEGRARLLALFGSGLGNEPVSRMLREFISREFLLRVVGRISEDDAELRATLVISHLIGVALMRYLVKVEPLASVEVDDLVEILAPTLQRYLTEEI